jgi:hypothetical protein
MRNLCKNVQDYAARQQWTFPKVLHFDADFRYKRNKKSYSVRTDKRRQNSCPKGQWIKQKTALGQNICPMEVPTKFMTLGNLGTFEDGYMYESEDPITKMNVASINYLGEKTGGTYANGQPEWKHTGFMLTCDECPAAR